MGKQRETALYLSRLILPLSNPTTQRDSWSHPCEPQLSYNSGPGALSRRVNFLPECLCERRTEMSQRCAGWLVWWSPSGGWDGGGSLALTGGPRDRMTGRREETRERPGNTSERGLLFRMSGIYSPSSSNLNSAFPHDGKVVTVTLPSRIFALALSSNHCTLCKSNRGFPRQLSTKETACQCRRRIFNPWSGRSSGGENGNPLQCSCLGSPTDRGARWAAVREVTRSRTRLTTGMLGLWCVVLSHSVMSNSLRPRGL